MKIFLSFLFLIILSSKCSAQIIDKNFLTANPNFNRFALYKTDEIKNLNVNIQSNKIKNFSLDHKSFVIGNDLKKALEFENKINFGVKALGGGILSLNGTNQRVFGNNFEHNYLGATYSFNNKNTSLNFNYKNYGTTNNSNYNMLELNINARL